jgi:twitching motility protein PilT
MKDSQIEQKLKRLLNLLISQNGSDLHLSAGNYPRIRIDNHLIQVDGEELLSKTEIEGLADSILNEDKKNKLRKERQIDFSIDFESDVRFRTNIFFQKGMLSICMRLISDKIKNLEELNLPQSLYNFAQKKQGLFLVVGPNGHGKTTTLAALIDYINKNYSKHIVTIEDPIEYSFISDKSLIEQREVYDDAVSFNLALKSCFREDVDVILVGEMRDLETISTAITAAETGHLILATLHTNDSIQTIDRIIDIFPSNQQNQVRQQLANVLVGVFSQRLIKSIGKGRLPAYELLINNNAVENLIRQNQTHQIQTIMETSFDEGMHSINCSLAQLVLEGKVKLEEAEGYATDINAFKMMLET